MLMMNVDEFKNDEIFCDCNLFYFSQHLLEFLLAADF